MHEVVRARSDCQFDERLRTGVVEHYANGIGRVFLCLSDYKQPVGVGNVKGHDEERGFINFHFRQRFFEVRGGNYDLKIVR